MSTHPETVGEEKRPGAHHKTIQCVIVTPEKTVLDQSVDFVALPLYDGELGILPGHSPLIARLGQGELRTKQHETVHRYFVDSGFVQIRDDVVTVLTHRALAAEAIDPAVANRELELAVEKRALSDEELADKLKALARTRAMLRLSKRRG
jgi:F-type H+-transporting ATPase subunit epsilon